MPNAYKEAQTCVICFEVIKTPIGEVSKCKHRYCFNCIENWCKKLTACPLCREPITCIIKTLRNGVRRNIRVKYRGETEYERELSDEYEEEEVLSDADDPCVVCGRADDEGALLLCDGIVGRSVSGEGIRCNAPCHYYCADGNLTCVPLGEWLCPFCRPEQGALRFRAPAANRYSIQDLPGPSRSQAVLIRSISINLSDAESISLEGTDDPLSSESSSSEDSDGGRNYNIILDGNDTSFSVVQDLSSSEESEDELEICDVSVLSNHNKDSSNDSDSVGNGYLMDTDIGEFFSNGSSSDVEKENWLDLDKRVLESDSDVEHLRPSGGRTIVTRTRKRARRRNVNRRRNVGSSRPTQTSSRAEGGIGAVRGRGRRYHRRKKRRAAKRKVKNKSGCNTRNSRKRNGHLDRLFDRSTLSINGRGLHDFTFDDSSTSVATNTQANSVNRSANRSEIHNDLLGAIILDQEKILAPASSLRIGRDGSIAARDSTTITCRRNREKNLRLTEGEEMVVVGERQELGKRRSRPTRWSQSTPTSSSFQCLQNTAASIPLPLGQPTPRKFAIDSIPTPPCAQFPAIPFVSRPSAALNHSAFAPFAMNQFPSAVPSISSYIQQAPSQRQHIAIPSLSAAGINQQPLFQMQPLLSNILMPSPLSIGVNNILAANLLANSHVPPISQRNPFLVSSMQQLIQQNQENMASTSSVANSLFGRIGSARRLSPSSPMAFSEDGDDMEQHREDRSSQQHVFQPDSIIHGSRTLAGVPPPQPVCEVRDEDAVESFEEKIIQLDEMREDEKQKYPDDRNPADESCLCPSRKSASADDEEIDESAARRKRKTCEMFEEARRMLSETLKKEYRKKVITKDEYKFIMKKGVTALSQRTRLDQRKVNDYARKYVQCIIHRRR